MYIFFINLKIQGINLAKFTEKWPSAYQLRYAVSGMRYAVRGNRKLETQNSVVIIENSYLYPLC